VPAIVSPRQTTAEVYGIEAFPVEVEVNCGWGDTVIVIIMSISPILKFIISHKVRRQAIPSTPVSCP
jgi:hypothetical protein